MRYLLAALTHGDSHTLPRSLASFMRNVRPLPDASILYYDGDRQGANDAVLAARTATGWGDWSLALSGEPIGFCEASDDLWRIAAHHPGVDYVFWLEHDFVVLRPLALDALAAALAGDDTLAQMALMRNAVNETEKAAGGLFESRRDQYTPRDLYLEHRSYFTTNPSLMGQKFMREHPWPAYTTECEGRFGLDLLHAGFHFGVWGEGDPWCEHIGARDGFGY